MRIFTWPLLLVAVIVTCAGCKPGERTICRSLAELADQREDESGSAYEQELDATLSNEEACMYHLGGIAALHEEEWNDLSLCFARASTWDDVVVCDRVVSTLGISDLCYHLTEMRLKEDFPEAQHGDLETTASHEMSPRRRTLLAACIREERVRFQALGEKHGAFRACAMTAETSDDFDACVDENSVDDEETEEPTDEIEDDE